MHGVRSCALIYHQSVKKSETLCRSTSHFSIVAIAVLAPFIIIFDVVFLVHSYREVWKKTFLRLVQSKSLQFGDVFHSVHSSLVDYLAQVI